jgi:hypothetical protein
LDFATREFDDARVAARASTVGGVNGDLVSIFSAAENFNVAGVLGAGLGRFA